MGRKSGASYRHGGSSVKAASKEELREEEMRCLGLGHGGRNGWRLMMTGGSHLSVREREDAAYRFGNLTNWAVGRNEVWTESVPDGLFLFF
jgi:hypothetical protein